MGWFGRKSAAPAGRAYLPAFLQGEEGSGGFARGYAAQLDEVYRRNPVGQRSVRLVAGMVAGLTIYAGDEHDEAVKLVTRDGLLDCRSTGSSRSRRTPSSRAMSARAMKAGSSRRRSAIRAMPSAALPCRAKSMT